MSDENFKYGQIKAYEKTRDLISKEIEKLEKELKIGEEKKGA